MKYIVEVYTGDKFGAGTDANVYLTLRGKEGESGRRYLKKNLKDNNKFESGAVSDLEHYVFCPSFA